MRTTEATGAIDVRVLDLHTAFLDASRGQKRAFLSTGPGDRFWVHVLQQDAIRSALCEVQLGGMLRTVES